MKKWMIMVAALGVAALTALPASATPSTVVYNNIPSPQPGNVSSVGAEAYAFSEFGGQVQLAGSTRQNPSVTVLMSSWGCQAGHWYSHDCSTTPGSGFSVPIALNLYNVGSGNSVGSLIATVTKSFTIPYRPSADAVHCTGGRWYNAADSTCYNGYATPITFSLTGVTLPSNVIVSVAYNTSHYGYSPVGEGAACYTSSGGCGYDSLNIGLVTTGPTVGADPAPNAAYQNSPYGSQYCDGGAGGTGTFRLDDGCWAPDQIALTITAATINTPANADACKKDGWQTKTRADGSTFKNQGDCIQYVNTGK
jgi:hypothetical protein